MEHPRLAVYLVVKPYVPPPRCAHQHNVAITRSRSGQQSLLGKVAKRRPSSSTARPASIHSHVHPVFFRQDVKHKIAAVKRPAAVSHADVFFCWMHQKMPGNRNGVYRIRTDCCLIMWSTPRFAVTVDELTDTLETGRLKSSS